MGGRTAESTSITPLKLTSIDALKAAGSNPGSRTCFQSPDEISTRSGQLLPTPTFFAAVLTDAASVTSRGMLVILSAILSSSCNLPAERAETMTSPHSGASFSAVSRPIPELAPITQARRQRSGFSAILNSHEGLEQAPGNTLETGRFFSSCQADTILIRHDLRLVLNMLVQIRNITRSEVTDFVPIDA